MLELDDLKARGCSWSLTGMILRADRCSARTMLFQITTRTSLRRKQGPALHRLSFSAPQSQPARCCVRRDDRCYQLRTRIDNAYQHEALCPTVCSCPLSLCCAGSEALTAPPVCRCDLPGRRCLRSMMPIRTCCMFIGVRQPRPTYSRRCTCWRAVELCTHCVRQWQLQTCVA